MIPVNLIHEMDNGNKIIGCYPQMQNSSIIFAGTNNILYCEENVRLVDSTLNFKGNNSVIWLGTNRHKYKLIVNIWNDSVFHMGRDNWINQAITVMLSEQKHCFIGSDCLFSLNIMIRNSDAHLIYSCSDGRRINPTQSIYIGDHVWMGQDVRLLKGTQIDSGNIIGAASVVARKKIMHNSSWAGNPCRLIGEGVFWDNAGVPNWSAERTEKSMLYSDYITEYKQNCHEDYWIYKYDEAECMEWSELEEKFSTKMSPMEKCEYLIGLNERKMKNRFVHII